tara:strand:+ start:151 stop:471 length:321 start_codon:yes stop_codon:yes gene_type:complete
MQSADLGLPLHKLTSSSTPHSEQARANEQASGGLWAVGVRAASARFRVPSVVMRTPGLTGLGTWGYLIEITGVRELQCNYTVISGVVFQLHEICMPYIVPVIDGIA